MKVIKIFFSIIIVLFLAHSTRAMDTNFLCDALQELSEFQDTVAPQACKPTAERLQSTRVDIAHEKSTPPNTLMSDQSERPTLVFIEKTVQSIRDDLRGNNYTKTPCAWCNELVNNYSLKSHLNKKHKGILGQITMPGTHYPKTYQCLKCNSRANTLPILMRHYKSCTADPVETHLAELQKFLQTSTASVDSLNHTKQDGAHSATSPGNIDDLFEVLPPSIPEKHMRLSRKTSKPVVDLITKTVNFDVLAKRNQDYSWCPVCFKKLKEKNNEESLINHVNNSVTCKNIIGKLPCTSCITSNGTKASFNIRCCLIKRLTELIGPVDLLFYKPTNESELVSELIRIKSIIEPVTRPA